MLSKSKLYFNTFKIILVAEIIFLTLSFFIPQIPGWKMFTSYERIDFKLTDDQGQLIDQNQYLPTVIYYLSKVRILDFATFVCKKQVNHKLTLIIANEEKFQFSGDKCEFQKI